MPEYQVARVAVPKETWQTFRQVALTRGISIASYLGRLVETELRRRRARSVGTADPSTGEKDTALLALEDVRSASDELEDLAGRLARSAVAHGGAWSDVASSLRIPAEKARRAYESRPS